MAIGPFRLLVKVIATLFTAVQNKLINFDQSIEGSHKISRVHGNQITVRKYLDGVELDGVEFANISTALSSNIFDFFSALYINTSTLGFLYVS